MKTADSDLGSRIPRHKEYIEDTIHLLCPCVLSVFVVNTKLQRRLRSVYWGDARLS
jgi:hypothetical protein